MPGMFDRVKRLLVTGTLSDFVLMLKAIIIVFLVLLLVFTDYAGWVMLLWSALSL